MSETTKATASKVTKVTTKSATKVEQPISFTAMFDGVKKQYNIVTPKLLADMFNMEQPIVRRHLRKEFMPVFEHNLNDKWSMPITAESTKDVLKYFYERFAVSVTDTKASVTA